jgi:uncharacterized DUF497 family protein/predicted DNA binding CopG/RHH family protein
MTLVQFEWDDNKDIENQAKHQVSFRNAQAAFADPYRVIAKDLAHSEAEKRFYCIGKAGGGILTARFTYRRKERQFMKKKIVYTDEPMGDVEVVADFLPSPAELAFKEDGVKVTLALSKSSVEFFKSEAAKHHTQYQRMIRRLLDSYVEAQGTLASKPKRTVHKPAPI